MTNAAQTPNPPPPRHPLSIAARLLAWVAALLGMVAISCGVMTLRQALACRDWPTTEGVMKRATIGHSKQELASIAYNYSVAGVPYAGAQLAFGQDLTHGQWIVQRYPVGTNVTVHYSPAHPNVAVLEPGVHGGTWTLLGVGTGFLVMGALLLYYMERERQGATGQTRG